jgi:hypothetical protein
MKTKLQESGASGVLDAVEAPFEVRPPAAVGGLSG